MSGTSLIINRIKKLNRRFSPGKLFYDPDWIILGVNNICNLHCKMCDVGTVYKESNFYYHLMESKPLNMPLDLVKLTIDQTAKFFPKTKLGYAFTEPMIYPHLTESLHYANEKNIYTTLTTNGLNLEKFTDDLCNAGLNEIFISLDGPPEIHNTIRGHRRSFESAFAGIKKILENKNKPEVSVYCTITQWNMNHLAEFAEIFRDLGIKEIGFMHTNYTTDEIVNLHNEKFGNSYPAQCSSMKSIDLPEMNTGILYDEIQKLKRSPYPFKLTFSPELGTVEELDTFYFHPEIKIGKVCNDVFRNIMVKSDGTVIPSHGRCYKVNAGNIYNNTLKEIWNSESISDFRKTLMSEGGLLPACSRCCSAF